jgi:hypothetical protein
LVRRAYQTNAGRGVRSEIDVIEFVGREIFDSERCPGVAIRPSCGPPSNSRRASRFSAATIARNDPSRSRHSSRNGRNAAEKDDAVQALSQHHGTLRRSRRARLAPAWP